MCPMFRILMILLVILLGNKYFITVCLTAYANRVQIIQLCISSFINEVLHQWRRWLQPKQICVEQNCRSNFGDLLLFVFSGASQSESNYCWRLPTGSRGTSSPPHGNMTSWQQANNSFFISIFCTYDKMRLNPRIFLPTQSVQNHKLIAKILQPTL